MLNSILFLTHLLTLFVTESAKHYYSKDFCSNLIKEADLIKDINIKLCNLRKSRVSQDMMIRNSKNDRCLN